MSKRNMAGLTVRELGGGLGTYAAVRGVTPAEVESARVLVRFVRALLSSEMGEVGGVQIGDRWWRGPKWWRTVRSGLIRLGLTRDYQRSYVVVRKTDPAAHHDLWAVAVGKYLDDHFRSFGPQTKPPRVEVYNTPRDHVFVHFFGRDHLAQVADRLLPLLPMYEAAGEMAQAMADGTLDEHSAGENWSVVTSDDGDADEDRTDEHTPLQPKEGP